MPLRIHRASVAIVEPKLRVHRAAVTAAPTRGGLRVHRAAIVAAGVLAASAGADRTVEGLDVVTLNGANSSGAVTTWAWTQTSGPAVTLQDANTATATFVAPGTQTGAVLGFQLVVGDGTSTSTDTVQVQVFPHVEWRDIAGAWVPVRTRILDGPVAPAPVTPLTLRGVNIPDAAFDETHLPGTFGVNYTYPAPSTLQALHERGWRVFRVPFRWERIQPTLSAPFDAAELARLVSLVDTLTGLGDQVILDPHNQLDYMGAHFGAPGAWTTADAVDLWARLSAVFKGRPLVMYSLMNEPRGDKTAAANAAWKILAQNMLDAIRGNDDDTWTWIPAYNSSALGSFQDPIVGYGTTPFAVDDLARSGPEVHDYFDPTGQYTSTYATEVAAAGTTVNDPAGGPDFPDTLHKKVITRLRVFLDWLLANDQAGLIGEWGIPRDDVGDAEHVADAPRWAGLADRWWAEIDAYAARGARVTVTQWSAGQAWSAGYPLRMYAPDNLPYLPGVVGERHMTARPATGGFGVSFGTSFGA